MKVICEFTCSPRQSTFIDVVETRINQETNSKTTFYCESYNSNFFPTETFVNAIDLYITEQYVIGSYDSCKNVQFPSSGQLGLDLMCGPWGADKCSPLRWFGFMGDATMEVVPFQINYKIQNSTEKVGDFSPLNPKIVACNASVDVSFREFSGQLKFDC